MTCIVIALQHDLHADAVVGKLAGSADVVRIDPLQAPVQLGVDSRATDELIMNGLRLAAGEITGVLCRVALESIDVGRDVDVIERFSHKEYIGALAGLLLNVDERLWINYPWNESRADGKIFPLLKAQRLGLNVPRFIVSNDVGQLSSDNFGGGNWIIKPITDSAIALQGNAYVDVPDFDDFDAPYTTVFDPGKLSADNSDETPVLIQERIGKAAEIRAVVVDRQLFATSFVADSDTPVDGRLCKRRSEQVYEFPEPESAMIVDFVSSLGLRFATLDFVVDAEGKRWLVDVNPSGNWLWQELGSGIRISEYLAHALCGRLQ